MASRILDKAMSERQLQDAILELAAWRGWKRAHFRTSLDRSGRWATAVAADGAGYPDLTLVRPPRLLFLELKSERGRLSAAQENWLRLLRQVPGVEVHVVRPRDMDMVEELLR